MALTNVVVFFPHVFIEHGDLKGFTNQVLQLDVVKNELFVVFRLERAFLHGRFEVPFRTHITRWK